MIRHRSSSMWMERVASSAWRKLYGQNGVISKTATFDKPFWCNAMVLLVINILTMSAVGNKLFNWIVERKLPDNESNREYCVQSIGIYNNSFFYLNRSVKLRKLSLLDSLYVQSHILSATHAHLRCLHVEWMRSRILKIYSMYIENNRNKGRMKGDLKHFRF